MIEPITQERWQQAQTAELKAVTYDDPQRSRAAYANIFDYLGMSFDQSNKFIAEIGCGAYPAVAFCGDIAAIVYEPLWFDSLREISHRIDWYQRAFEDVANPLNVDETWIFNCLQHVRDPELVVLKAKETSQVVRYFEPVDYPTCEYHPHTFSQGDFERWFGEANRYTDRLPGFFDADCCYGTWQA